ncbi:hypothetical protein BGV48_26880 [Burkholderia ubonensis]|nr:hypothetical protein BGV48_26880 [Burkholderia ubonensis]
MNSMAVGVDIAKRVFQVHYVDRETGEIVNKAIKREKFLEHFANRAACRIGMEACGGAHHWVRQLTQIGHEVRLMPAEFVKAFNICNKSVSRTQGDLRCCTEDGRRPPGAGFQEQASNRPVLLRSKDVVVSDRGKVIR